MTATSFEIRTLVREGRRDEATKAAARLLSAAASVTSTRRFEGAIRLWSMAASIASTSSSCSRSDAETLNATCPPSWISRMRW